MLNIGKRTKTYKTFKSLKKFYSIIYDKFTSRPELNTKRIALNKLFIDSSEANHKQINKTKQ